MRRDDVLLSLATACTRDDAGRHFTETMAADVIGELERRGWVAITRPIHRETGIRYAEEYWSLEVTPDGQAELDAWDRHPCQEEDRP